MNISRYYLLGAGLIAIVFVAYFFFGSTTAAPAAPASTPLTVGSADIQVIGDATVTELPSEPVVTQPSLDRSTEIAPSTLSSDTQKVIQAKIATLVASIKKTPNDLSLWIQLGFRRKQLGDYVGAAEAWVYVNTLAPTDEVSAIDLGDLYMNFAKDYPKAELYYKKALAANSKNIDTYNNLHTLYKYLYKTDTTGAADIVKQALQAFPNDSAYIKSW